MKGKGDGLVVGEVVEVGTAGEVVSPLVGESVGKGAMGESVGSGVGLGVGPQSALNGFSLPSHPF